MVIPFGIASVGPGLIFQDEYARLHNYEYFHERNDDLIHMEWLAYSHNLDPLKDAWDMLGSTLAKMEPQREKMLAKIKFSGHNDAFRQFQNFTDR